MKQIVLTSKHMKQTGASSRLCLPHYSMSWFAKVVGFGLDVKLSVHTQKWNIILKQPQPAVAKILKKPSPLCLFFSRGLPLCLCPLTSWRLRWRISLPRVDQSLSDFLGSSLFLSKGCWKNMPLGITHTSCTVHAYVHFCCSSSNICHLTAWTFLSKASYTWGVKQGK